MHDSAHFSEHLEFLQTDAGRALRGVRGPAAGAAMRAALFGMYRCVCFGHMEVYACELKATTMSYWFQS